MSSISSKGRAWDALALTIKDRDGYVCQYQFGGCTYDQDLTVDHITPKNRGGVDEDWNLITACRTCNGRKKDNVLLRVNWFDREWLPKGTGIGV